MDQGNGKRTIPTLSAETDILCNRLKKLKVGQLVTYEELSSAIGKNVLMVRGSLASARRKAEREEGVVTVVVRSIGIKHADASDHNGIVASARKRLRRGAKRALRSSLHMPKEEYEKLTREQQNDLNMGRSMLGAVSFFTGHLAEKKLKPRVETANERLAIGDVIKQFQG